MKIFKRLSLISLITLSLNAQEKIQKVVEPFTKITASGTLKIQYRISDTNQVVVTGDNKDFSKIEFFNEGNVLVIRSDGSSVGILNISISGNKLNEIDLSGLISFEANQEIQASDFHISLSGASNARFNLNSNSINAIVKGICELNLKGTSHLFDANVEGGSNVNAFDLKTDTCIIDASGISTAKIQVIRKAKLNATGASTIKFKGDPKEILAEGSTLSKIIKIGKESESIKSLPNDTTKSKLTFKFRDKNIIIKDDNDSKDNSVWHKNHNNHTLKHWQGLWIGFGGYTNPKMGFTMSKSNKYMELDYGKSFNFQWNLLQKNINLYKKNIQLSTGLGFEFNNLSFENKTRLNPDSSFTSGIIDSTNQYNYKKNRFKQSYLTVPFLLSFNTNKERKKNFHLTCGVVGKYLLLSGTKQVLKKNADEFKLKRRDSYNLNPFQLNAYVSVGYRNFTIFGQYAVTELFKKNKGPQLYSFAFGLRLFSFD
ncbi:MAG: GIN domain-containing protein [Bacteroidota bacterium]